MDDLQQDDAASLNSDVTLAQISPPADTLEPLWSQALQDYQHRTGLDPREHVLTRELANCDSLDEILRLFDLQMDGFKRFRSGSSRWYTLRNVYLKPSAQVLLILNGILKDTSQSFVCLVLHVCYHTVERRSRNSPVEVSCLLLLVHYWPCVDSPLSAGIVG